MFVTAVIISVVLLIVYRSITMACQLTAAAEVSLGPLVPQPRRSGVAR
jgi:hypothetical protein